MLEIVLFLLGIGKEQETEGGVLTAQFWPTDATSSQHRLRVKALPVRDDVHHAFMTRPRHTSGSTRN